MRLIDADALIQKESVMRKGCAYIEEINNAPTIDAEPTKHGKWIEAEWVDLNDWTTWRECSCCGESLSKYVEGFGRRDFPQMNYCPNCGAKMKGQEE